MPSTNVGMSGSGNSCAIPGKRCSSAVGMCVAMCHAACGPKYGSALPCHTDVGIVTAASWSSVTPKPSIAVSWRAVPSGR